MIKKIILLFIMGIGCSVVFYKTTFSYDDKTTHPGLTDEIVDFYNFSSENKLNDEEKEWIVLGSVNEDTPPRWINHFYDPTTGDGWKAENLGDISPLTLQIFSKIFLNINTETVSSKNWAHNEYLQAKYANYWGNRTWENAIRQYVAGDKMFAYQTLGDILHLLEDATVPDHTRNDTHAHEGTMLTQDGGSPYEDYSSDWNRRNLNIAQDLKNNNKSPIILNSIDAYFDALANYSNRYFFSEHTINSKKYSEPKILRENDDYGYGKDKNGNEFLLVKKEETVNIKTGDIIKSYTLNNKKVLSAYFFLLSREAVLNGAGVIKLFKEEVAKAEKDKNLIKEEPEISWWQKTRSPLYGVIIPTYNSGASIVNDIKEVGYSTILIVADTADKAVANTKIYANTVSSVFDNTINETIAVVNKAVEGVKDIFSQPQQINPMALVANIGQVAGNQTISDEQLAISLPGQGDQQLITDDQQSAVGNEQLTISDERPVIISNKQLAISDQQQPEIIHAPYQPPQNQVIHEPYQAKTNSISVASSDGSIFIPTGQYPNIYINSPPPQENQVDDQSIEEIESQEQEQEQDTTPPEKPIITTNNSQNFTVLTTEIILEGLKTEDAKEILINDNSENVIYPATTSWQKSIMLMEGENIFEIKANDEAGNISESATINIIFKEPLINFYLTDYDVRKMNFTLNWGDENSVIKKWELEYKFAPNLEWQNIAISDQQLAISHTFTADYDDVIYQFRLRGKDTGGNFSDWLTLEAEISTKPVIINEIAWMGTQASSSDEWIELYNKTSRDIDLAGWVLESPDGSPKIEFDENYKNKVKTNEGKIPTIKAKSYFLLERTNDDTTSEEGDWFFSGALNDVDIEKDEEDRKQVEGLVLKYGDDVMDQIDLWYAGEKSEKKSMERISPFYSGNDIDNWKDNDEKKFNGKDAKENNILGTPKQKNSAIKIIDGEFDRNVNFYAFPDVEYLISDFKLEEDYSLTAHPGAVLKFKNNGKMEIKGALFAKGAKDKKIYFTSENDDLVGSDINADGNSLNPDVGDWDGVYIENSSEAQLEWVEMKYVYSALSVNTSDVQINNSLISYFGDAVYSQDGNLTILNNIFEGSGNSRAIYTSGGTLTLKDNVFQNNEIPLYVDYKTDLINSGNIAEENEYTGIFLYSEGHNYKYDFNRTLHKDLPYIFVKNLVIENGAELILEPGVVVKFGKSSRNESSIDIYGKLIAKGMPEDKIIITSFNDDSVGGEISKGDYGNYAADYWGGLNFNSGSQDSLIENFVLRKSDDGMYFGEVTMNLTGVEIADSEDDGIVGYNSVLNFKDSHFTDIKGSGFVVYGGSVASISSTVMENIDGDAIVVFGDSVLTLENSLIKNSGSDRGDAVIIFNNSVVDIINSVLKNGENDGIVIFGDSAVNINNSTLENFQGSAVLVADDDISVNIEDSILRNNDYGVNVIGDSLVNVSDNEIYDNNQYGVFNDIAENTNIISAQNNWWGDSSGPHHPELNESGVGNDVSDGVDFAPWAENSGE